jgi:hypothetical protein
MGHLMFQSSVRPAKTCFNFIEREHFLEIPLSIETPSTNQRRPNMRIPKALRTAIRTRLMTDIRPLTTKQITESVNPIVTKSNQRTSRQMAFVLKQMVREGDLMVAKETKNGLTPSGNERSRVEYILNFETVDPDIVEESQ